MDVESRAYKADTVQWPGFRRRITTMNFPWIMLTHDCLWYRIQCRQILQHGGLAGGGLGVDCCVGSFCRPCWSAWWMNGWMDASWRTQIVRGSNKRRTLKTMLVFSPSHFSGWWKLNSASLKCSSQVAAPSANSRPQEGVGCGRPTRATPAR